MTRSNQLAVSLILAFVVTLAVHKTIVSPPAVPTSDASASDSNDMMGLLLRLSFYF